MRHPEAIQLSDVHRFSKLLAETARHSDLATPVPTCGDWTLGDLVWHLTEVQDFWTFIIANRPKGPQYYERPTRANDNRLVANLRNATVGLLAELELCMPDEPAWTWSQEQTVGFTMRRQVHEALTHAVDAVLAVGEPLPDVAPALAADGIDELLTVILADPNTAPPSGEIVLHATDTNDEVTLPFGTGSCRIAGRALPLNLWMWGRTNTFALRITGDVDQARQLRSTIAQTA